MPHPFRFAVQSFNADSGQDWATKVQRAESLGYSAFHLADHLIGPGPALSRTNHPIQGLAAVPAMAYAAAVTSTINIGCRVFCVDYRLPVVLAKEAMTIDLLSGGRLELGLGAGWLKDEYEAVGLTMDSPGTRISRLGGAVPLPRPYSQASTPFFCVGSKSYRRAKDGAWTHRDPTLLICRHTLMSTTW